MEYEDKLRMNSKRIILELERFDDIIEEMKQHLDSETRYPLYHELSKYLIVFGEGLEKYKKEVCELINEARPCHFEDFESFE